MKLKSIVKLSLLSLGAIYALSSQAAQFIVPPHYNVEVVDYLMHKTITENALSASIMNLVYKKNIKVEAVPEVKDEYKFTLVTRNKLSDTDEYYRQAMEAYAEAIIAAEEKRGTKELLLRK